MEYFIAIYISGVFTAMWALYYPAWKIIKAANPNNLLVTHPIMSFLIVLFFFTLFISDTIALSFFTTVHVQHPNLELPHEGVVLSITIGTSAITVLHFVCFYAFH